MGAIHRPARKHARENASRTDVIDLGALVRGAGEGDAACWDALVARFSGLIWSVARGFGLSMVDAAEVSQTVWLRLTEHVSRIERPERLGAWLVTSARRECLRHLRLHGRDALIEGDVLDHLSAPGSASVEARVLAEERDAALWRAFNELPERSRTLLLMLVTDPPISYNEIAEVLEMPIGSIGPTRSRLLAALRRRVEAAGVSAGD